MVAQRQGDLLRVARQHVDGVPVSVRRRVDLNVGVNYDVTRDGRFLINDVLVAPITVIQNWKPPTDQR